jgi:transcription initiation factor TFIID subunit 7
MKLLIILTIYEIFISGMYKGHEADSPAELESQFILRLPEEPSRVLSEAIRNNSTLKDRLSIKIENDMRHGEVRVDHWLLPAKVMDLPTIVESLKTIDYKGIYKTADICQMLVCKEEDDQATTDEDSPQKSKRKDPNKVENKYLIPHGITPPAKNVRKRSGRNAGPRHALGQSERPTGPELSPIAYRFWRTVIKKVN